MMEIISRLQTTTDPVIKEFYRDENNFVDLINAVFFKGHQIITKEQLSHYYNDSSTCFDQNGLIKTLGKNRDVIMHCSGENALFIGLEAQSTIDYTMPFRLLTYDTINYNQQFNLLDERKRGSFKPTPIFSFVLYHGEERWIQPYHLKEMMKLPKRFEERINDWECPVVDIKDIDVSCIKREEHYRVVYTVQEFYKWNKDPQSVDITLNRKEAIVVLSMLGMKELKMKVEESTQEEINMCSKIREAFEEQKQLGKMEGIVEGEARGKREGEILTIMMILQSKFGKVSSEVNEKIQVSSKEKLDSLTRSLLQIREERDILNILS